MRGLGALALAVEQVAVHLGLHPEILPSQLLASLKTKGFASADRLGRREEIAREMQHEHKELALVLEQR